jgi:hypothetical protein
MTAAFAALLASAACGVEAFQVAAIDYFRPPAGALTEPARSLGAPLRELIGGLREDGEVAKGLPADVLGAHGGEYSDGG